MKIFSVVTSDVCRDGGVDRSLDRFEPNLAKDCVQYARTSTESGARLICRLT